MLEVENYLIWLEIPNLAGVEFYQIIVIWLDSDRGLASVEKINCIFFGWNTYFWLQCTTAMSWMSSEWPLVNVIAAHEHSN